MQKITALKISLTCLGMLLFAGCSSTPSKSGSVQISSLTMSGYSKPLDREQSANYQKLQQHYLKWKGTPYQMGGLNKNGIDCSGFVHVAFRDAFGMEVPRSTDALAREGDQIHPDQLEVGDLVFFKTGRTKRHVGIYVGNQHFIHASTSSGVMKSNLTNPYWQEHYWKSTRLLSN